jgi:large subunit ribosomal protein L32e
MTEDRDEFIETISQLPGVGEAKAEALWEAGYRSIEEVRESSAEELADEVDGVGPKLADAILQGIEDLEAEPEPEVEIVEETEAEEPEEAEEAAEIVEDDEHIPKPKPDLDEETKRALKIRKRINEQRPNFVRRNWWQFPRFDKDHSWRKPRGTHSKMREDKKHAPKRVKVGYRGPKQARGLHPSGFEDVLVHNTDDLEELDPDTQAARIASKVGKRKRIKIIEEAQEMGIHVLNPGRVNE